LVEVDWLEKNLDKLTLSQICKIPKAYIRNRKNYKGSDVFLQLHILKAACLTFKHEKNIDLRYFLGNYILPQACRERIIFNIKRILAVPRN
jgi:hypothetical protein